MALEKRAIFKENQYRDYDTAGWAFLPLITCTSCNLSDTCLHLLFCLAQLQTERALECSCVGDNPAEDLKSCKCSRLGPAQRWLVRLLWERPCALLGLPATAPTLAVFGGVPVTGHLTTSWRYRFLVPPVSTMITYTRRHIKIAKNNSFNHTQ